jgi:hypothetical protein
MTTNLKRRDLLKTVSAAGGLLLLGGAASAAASAAEPERANTLDGEWLKDGKLDQPCAIFTQGRVMLLVNENGDLAVGFMTEADKFSVCKGSWGEGVAGEVVRNGKTIRWKAGGSWKRP